MNARELTQVSMKLKGIINAVDAGSLLTLASELENSVLKSGLGTYDAAVIGRMRSSRNARGHYTIHTDDVDSIKGIKAVVNLLRSTEAASNTLIKPIIEEVMNHLNTGSKVGTAANALSGIVGSLQEYGAAKWQDLWKPTLVEYDNNPHYKNMPTANRVDQGIQLYQDITALKFYMGQIGAVMPSLSRLDDEAKNTIAVLQTAVADSTVIEAATTVQNVNDMKRTMGGAVDFTAATSENMQTNELDRTLDSVKTAAKMGISADDHSKYYDTKADRYQIAEISKTAKNTPPASQNMMIAYNVSDRAKKAIASVNQFMATWDKNNALPVSQLPAMLELLNKTGKIVKEMQQMDNDKLSTLIRGDVNQAMEKILSTLGPKLPQLAAIAQETELKLGLKDNVLLSNLRDISSQYEAAATSFNLPATAQYPYAEQKKAVIEKMQGESEARLSELEAMKSELTGRSYDTLPTMSELSVMNRQSKKIATPAGSAYHEAVKKLIKKTTGMDKLEIDIDKAEASLFRLSELADINRTSDHNVLVKQGIANVRQLYQMRDQLQKMIDKPESGKIQHYAHSKSSIGVVEKGQVACSVPKSLNPAATKAFSDIDGLISAEKNLLVRLNNSAKQNRALLSKSQNVKQNRLNAVKGMKNTAIATMRGKVAEGQRASRGQSYASLQQKANPPDDRAIMDAVIAKKKGPVIMHCQKTRQSMINNSRNYLSERQFSSLGNDNKTHGLYDISPGDGLLVANIKQMSNTIIKVEKLMVKVNRITAHMKAGGLQYANLISILPEIKNDIGDLIEELKAGNETLLQLRESLSDTAGEELRAGMNNVIGMINRNFPSKLLEICSDAQTEVLAAIDPKYADQTRELFNQANDFIINTDNFLRNSGKPKVSTPTSSRRTSMDEKPSSINSAPIQTMITILNNKLEGSPATKQKKGQLYQLTKLKDGSDEKNMASVVNALVNLDGSLKAVVKLSGTKGLLGGGDLIKNIKGVYTALSHATPSVLVAMQPQIKALLESSEPVISQLYVSAAVTEATLGLRETTLTAPLDSLVNSFSDLAGKYEVPLKEEPPYLKGQLDLVNKQIERLLEQKGGTDVKDKLIKVQTDRLTQVNMDLRDRIDNDAEKAPQRVVRT